MKDNKRNSPFDCQRHPAGRPSPMNESPKWPENIEKLRKQMNWPEGGPLPGLALDLASTPTEVEFCTELPFWLLTPTFGYAVRLDETTVDLSISHDYVELHRGQAYRPGGEAIFYVGKMQSQESDDEQLIVRHLRTVVSFRPSVPSDVVNALNSETEDTILDLTSEEIDIAAYTASLRKRQAVEYFQVLAIAYLQFVNTFVDTYRRLACDPFAHSVSLWDVPQWFVIVGERCNRIHSVPYLRLDTYPMVTKFSRDEHRPVVLTTPEKLATALANEPFPGELDMHDAWNHFYCGRYSEAVRTAVTAIEVVLEECLRRALVARKNSPEEVQARLRRTFNDFEARLQDYSHVTKRTMPGPILSIVPYINGVRLRQEVEAARQLRHKVVHEALRIDIINRGPLQRIVETLSWTFEWFVNDENHEIRPSQPYGLLALWAGGQKGKLNFEYHAAGVTVFDEAARQYASLKEEKIRLAEDDLYDQLSLAISPQTPDADKFAAMAGEYLQFPAVFTADAPEIQSPFVHPRLLFVESDGLSRPVFCFDSANAVTTADVAQIAAKGMSMWREGKRFKPAICLINHQGSLPWEYRDGRAAADSGAIVMAEACGIALIATCDLLRILLSLRKGMWNVDAVRIALCEPGVQGRHPTHLTRIGQIEHFYSKKAVARVVLDDGANLRQGDRVAVRLKKEFYEQDVLSIEIDRVPVESATGSTIGIPLALKRNDIPEMAEVFKCGAQSISPKSQESPNVPLTTMFCVGCGAVSEHEKGGAEKSLSGRYMRNYRCARCGLGLKLISEKQEGPSRAFSLGS